MDFTLILLVILLIIVIGLFVAALRAGRGRDSAHPGDEAREGQGRQAPDRQVIARAQSPQAIAAPQQRTAETSTTLAPQPSAAQGVAMGRGAGGVGEQGRRVVVDTARARGAEPQAAVFAPGVRPTAGAAAAPAGANIAATPVAATGMVSGGTTRGPEPAFHSEGGTPLGERRLPTDGASGADTTGATGATGPTRVGTGAITPTSRAADGSAVSGGAEGSVRVAASVPPATVVAAPPREVPPAASVGTAPLGQPTGPATATPPQSLGVATPPASPSVDQDGVSSEIGTSVGMELVGRPATRSGEIILSVGPGRLPFRLAELIGEQRGLEEAITMARRRIDDIELGPDPGSAENRVRLAVLRQDLTQKQERLREILFLQDGYHWLQGHMAPPHNS